MLSSSIAPPAERGHRTTSRFCIAHTLWPLAPRWAWAVRVKNWLNKPLINPLRRLKPCKKKRDCVLVEGVGGVLVPLGGRLFVTDLMAKLKLPIWVVARAGLGTINHTLSTVEVLSRRGLVPRRILLNNYKGRDLSERSNAKIIKSLTGISVTEVPCTSTRAREKKAKRLLLDAFVEDFRFDESN